VSLETTLLLISYLTGFALFISAAELLWLSRVREFQEIWSLDNLRAELSSALPTFLIDPLFSLKGFRIILSLQIILSLCLYFFSSPWIVLGLLLTHLLICIRFRGTFNGGSDMMTMVVLTGLLVGGKAGLIYISIHTLYSYFKAGLVKVKQADWRQGRALPAFFQRSLFKDVQNLAGKIPYPKTLGYFVIIFELSILLILLKPELTVLYFTAALLFHFINYLTFGLNRFFWIWLAAWPAVFYFTGANS